MTIADLIKDFLDTAKERLKNPFSGAFLYSFLIFNWRPILFLIFSDASIEHKIVDINYEYCTWSAIIIPLCMALFYTLLLPVIMLGIEIILKNTTDKRIKNSFLTKGVRMDGKIYIAEKEFTLKNRLSGNKEIQDYLDEIDSLKKLVEGHKESIKQINEANKANVDELNNSLKIANETANNAKKIISDRSFMDAGYQERINTKLMIETAGLPLEKKEHFKKLLAKLNISEIVFFNEIDIDKETIEINDYKEMYIEVIKSLQAKNLVDLISVDKESYYVLTNDGQIIFRIVRDIKETH